VALPASGGVGDQDMRLLNALEYTATVYQAVVDEHAARQRAEARKNDGDGKRQRRA
jgi:hypothetical protein